MATTDTHPAIETEQAGLADWERAFLIRAFETKLLQLFSEGRLFGTVHTCIGQEFTGIAVARHLIDGDQIVSNHRCHGHYLARTGDSKGLMAEVMGRVTGICGGRGGSQHICAGGVYSNGIQGGMVPIAAGMAFSHKLSGSRNIAVAFIGDGTLGEGIVYETLNIASKWQLPLLIVAEINGVAQSTKQSETLAGDILQRAQAFGIRTCRSDTWHPSHLIETIGDAVATMRDNPQPFFAAIDTYRLMAHSKGDDDRPREELAHHWAIDPLSRFEAEHPKTAKHAKEKADRAILDAVAEASEAPLASAPPLAASPNPEKLNWAPSLIPAKERVVARIHEGLKQGMREHPKLVMIGEDIEGPYGGAFKVTKNLSLDHPGRVKNTPISEAAIVGISTGLAFNGYLPVCEVMFGDFLTLAADQIINHASKFRWMYNDQVTVPLIIRTPMGGKRGYGSTHSQCLEKHFLGLPGTRILALNYRYDPAAIYRQLLSSAGTPTIVIENKTLYGEYVTHETAFGFSCEHSDEQFPTVRIRPGCQPDITIVCYGGCLADAEKAADKLFEDHEIAAEIICPSQIYPLNLSPIVESVRTSGRLLVVEEGQQFCGFGSEVVSATLEALQPASLRIGRVSAHPHPIPSCKPAELDSLPGVDTIVSAATKLTANA